MINKEYFEKNDNLENSSEYYFFNTRIKRLQSTLQGRLNLLNKFKGLFDKNHVTLTFKNIDINTNEEEEIVNFLIENTEYIHSYLINRVNGYFEIEGSK